MNEVTSIHQPGYSVTELSDGSGHQSVYAFVWSGRRTQTFDLEVRYSTKE